MSRLISIDFHCHSNYSDGRPNIYKIEERCLQDNFNVVLTDHNEIRGGIKLYERGRIMTVPALEAGTREGLEFLIYFSTVQEIEEFYKRAIEPYRRDRFMVQIDVSAEKLLNIANEYHCVISLAHPYGFRKKSLGFHSNNQQLMRTVKELVHGVEVYNGALSAKGNLRAKAIVESNTHYLSTVGSDGHDIESIGRVTADFMIDSSEIFSPSTLLDLLRAGDYEVKVESQSSKLKTLTDISISHTKYFFDKGQSIESRVS